MRPSLLHLQLHLFDPAKGASTIPPELRQRLLPLIVALLSEATEAGETPATTEASNE